MIRTVEIPDLPGVDQSVLDRLQRGRRTAAHHQGASVEILFPDDILSGERIVFVRDQIDAAFKQLMDGDPGDLLRLLLQRKQDIDLIAQKGLDAVFIPEYGRDLNVAVCLRKKPYGFREKIYGLPDHEADGDAVPVGRAEILPLLDGAFQLLPHAGEEGDELRSRRRQSGALSAAFKDREADLFFQQPDLIGQGRLADKHILRRPAEVQGMGKLYTIVDLFRGHGALLLFKN